MPATEKPAEKADVKLYQLRKGTSLYQPAVRYFQDINAYLAGVERIVKKYGADSAMMGNAGTLDGLYFPDKAPPKWKLEAPWFYHAPKEKLPAAKELKAPRRPWSDNYVGTLSKAWDAIPYNERPYAKMHLSKLGQDFILAVQFSAARDQKELNLYRSPLDGQKLLNETGLDALRNAASDEDRFIFDHDIAEVKNDKGHRTYFHAAHIELSPLFHQSAAMQDVTQQRKARHEKWEANPIKRAGDKVISCALFPVVALIVMSGAAEPFFRGGRGSGGPR